jgi:CxxC motif-containing protein (DUF1111 family)
VKPSRATRRRLAVVTLIAGAATAATPDRLPPEALSGGTFTVADDSDQAYGQLAAGLDAADLAIALKGREGMQQRWVVAPSILGLWGRGPLSNGEVCTDCHANNGRGAPPAAADEPMRSMVLRLSLPGRDAAGGPTPHPGYGVQLQHQGVLGMVPAEGEALIAWSTHTVTLPDGQTVELRAPRVRLRHLAYGPIEAQTLLSARIAPPVVGLGLLEAVPESTLRDLAARALPDGVRGRVNRVFDHETRTTVVGRFGLKASQPGLRQQIATAFHEDLGVTSPLFPTENCMPAQRECRAMPPGGKPELTGRQLEALTAYLRSLGVPARRDTAHPDVVRGERLFAELGCALCHVPVLVTGTGAALPQLDGQTIRPYTDLLLHDMGDGLADGRPEFEAGPRDWRTAPLWGLGLSARVNGNAQLLHDGRARTVEEAILWHGGEATTARDRYALLPAGDRAALRRFLDSL